MFRVYLRLKLGDSIAQSVQTPSVEFWFRVALIQSASFLTGGLDEIVFRRFYTENQPQNHQQNGQCKLLLSPVSSSIDEPIGRVRKIGGRSVSPLEKSVGGDGVVSLQSQIPAKLQAESKRMYGFNNSHAGILLDENFFSIFNTILANSAK